LSDVDSLGDGCDASCDGGVAGSNNETTSSNSSIGSSADGVNGVQHGVTARASARQSRVILGSAKGSLTLDSLASILEVRSSCDGSTRSEMSSTLVQSKVHCGLGDGNGRRWDGGWEVSGSGGSNGRLVNSGSASDCG